MSLNSPLPRTVRIRVDFISPPCRILLYNREYVTITSIEGSGCTRKLYLNGGPRYIMRGVSDQLEQVIG